MGFRFDDYYREILNDNKGFLLNELRSDIADELSRKNIKGLPFNNIFGSALRLVVPITESEEFSELIDILYSSELFNFSYFDFSKKKAIIKIQTQRGEKDREETLSSLVLKMHKAGELDDLEKTKWIKWIEQNTTTLGDRKEDSILLSRAPIDVVRMSDISKIISCHSQGGSYFRCAQEEATSGGIVAYLVKNSELDKLSENEIANNIEIFADKERGIEGIEAKARTRVRKYKLDDEYDLGIPEETIYYSSNNDRTKTTKNAAFLSALKNFLKNKQNDYDFDTIKELYSKRKITKGGGNYFDTPDSKLFNTYFSSEIKDSKSERFRGEIEYSDEVAESISGYNQLKQELDQFHAEGIRVLEHSTFNYDLDDSDDDYPYFTMWGHMSIDLDVVVDRSFPEFDINDSYEYDKLYIGGESRVLDDDEIGMIIDFIRSLKFKDEIGGISFEKNSLKLYPKGIEESHYNADEYYSLIETLKDWERRYDDALSSFIQILYRQNYLKHLSTADKEKYGIIESESSIPKFNNLKNVKPYSDGNYSGEIQFPIRDNPIQPILDSDAFVYLENNFYSYIFNHIKSHYKEPSDSGYTQSEFKFESKDILLGSSKLNLNISSRTSFDGEKYSINLIFTTKDLNILKFIDNSHDDFKNILNMLLLEIHKQKSSRQNFDYEQLSKVYKNAK